MISGFGLNDVQDKKNLEGNNFPKTFSELKNSVEAILYGVGYGQGKILNFSEGDKKNRSNIWAYQSLGEGGCVIRYGNENNLKEEDDGETIYFLRISDIKGQNCLADASLEFIGATGSLIHRTKKALEEKASFPWFER